MKPICISYRCFEEYYKNILNEKNLKVIDTKFRHFRFQLFSGIFVRIKDIIRSYRDLYKKLIGYVPKNAYFTPVKWLDPINLRQSEGSIEVMLSSPLFFDIDINRPASITSFEDVKENSLKLINFIENQFGRTPDLIVFSGRRGFHIYYWDWDTNNIIKLSPKLRISYFKKNRAMIISLLKERNIFVDSIVTLNPYQLLRIPFSLHGKTGLPAKVIGNIFDFDLDNVDFLEFRNRR